MTLDVANVAQDVELGCEGCDQPLLGCRLGTDAVDDGGLLSEHTVIPRGLFWYLLLWRVLVL